MRSGFKRFRRRINRAVFGKSLLFGLSLALLSAAVVLLLGKLNVIEDNLILALAVFGGVGFVSIIVWYIIIRPRESKAAKLIDDELKIKEKAQTMLAYRGVRTVMARLQREQTEKLLLKLPTAWYTVKRVWLYILVFALSLAFCAVAYFMPDKQTPPPPIPPEEPFELTEWQETALINLIEYVEDSALRDSAKASVTDELEQLLEALRLATLDRQMRTLVIGAIKNISETIDTTNTYDEIVAAFKISETLGTKELSDAIGTPKAPLPADKFDAFCAMFTEGDADQIKSTLASLSIDIDVKLGAINVAQDPLMSALSSFAERIFEDIFENPDVDDSNINAAVEELMSSLGTSLSIALSEQLVNEDVGAYTVEQLMTIFGISESELPPEVEDEIGNLGGGGDDGSDDGDDDDEQKGDSGGYGSGEVIFGSDDLMYYPDEERYVQYGEIINEYFAKITEKILNGEISPELAERINKYFETLRTAPKDEGGGE